MLATASCGGQSPRFLHRPFGLKHPDRAAAGPLGHIHGPICGIGQIFGASSTVRPAGNAYAGVYRDLMVPQVERLLQSGENSLCHGQWVSVIPLRVGEEYRELISAESCNKTICALLQAFPHSNQQRIAGRVPMCVVDWLEAVEIDEKDRALSPASPRFS